jgi:hypothetical protein
MPAALLLAGVAWSPLLCVVDSGKLNLQQNVLYLAKQVWTPWLQTLVGSPTILLGNHVLPAAMLHTPYC